MGTTFDRYLIARYLQIFVILFVSMFGLYIVIDGFSNVDEFQEHSKSAWDLFVRMGSYYGYQSTLFLDMCGPILTVIDAMIVFALLLRNSELHPVLAAGVPTWRLLVPIVVSTAAVNGFMTVNQELIIPRIADILQTPRDSLMRGSITDIEPLDDPSTGIHIDGQELSLNPQLIKNPQFVLPPGIAQGVITLKAKEAIYYAAKGDRPAGWRLKDVETPYSQLALTPEGRTIVRKPENPRELFITSELSFDLLYNRVQSSKLISTAELIRRLRSPAFGQATARLAQHLHARLVRPLANIAAVLLAVPLILRKESRGLIANMAICAAVLVTVMGVSEAAAYCGRTGSLLPDLSAWIPVVVTGTLFAWLSELMQT